MSDTTNEIETPARDESRTPFVFCDSTTGRITMMGVVPAFMLSTQVPPNGQTLVLGAGSLDTDYVLNGAITPRPANPTVQTGSVLSNLPNPSTVTINGIAYTVDDGTLEMTFPNAGTYAITVQSFPYLDASFTYTQ